MSSHTDYWQTSHRWLTVIQTFLNKRFMLTEQSQRGVYTYEQSHLGSFFQYDLKKINSFGFTRPLTKSGKKCLCHHSCSTKTDHKIIIWVCKLMATTVTLALWHTATLGGLCKSTWISRLWHREKWLFISFVRYVGKCYIMAQSWFSVLQNLLELGWLCKWVKS